MVSLRLAALGLITTATLAGCPRELPGCAQIAGCNSQCCSRNTLCLEQICGPDVWVCQLAPSGHYQWFKNAPPCTPPDGSVTPPPPLPDGSVTPPDSATSGCRPGTCGSQARCVDTKCQCEQGYVNEDGDWGNGCEGADPDCGPMSCGHCPEDFCGDHAHCRDNAKCRCSEQHWKNGDGDWSNGCEEPAPDCSPTNCNACYLAFCGRNANCMANKCKCTVEGWANCDGVWQINGCECEQ